MRWIMVRLRRLGSVGAADNARRSLDEHRLAEARVDALVGRLAGNVARPQSRPRRRVPA